MSVPLRSTAACLGAVLALLAAARAQGEGMSEPNRMPVRQEDSSMQDRIGATIPRELAFIDERELPMLMQQFFPGDRPVVLDLGYFGCPGMCGQVMDGMVTALNQVDLEPGKDYEILTISIDPRETPAVAKQRKDAFLFKLQKVGGQQGWHFGVGSQAAIQSLTEAVGFRYFWSEHDNRFDHPPALIFLSPQGKVTRVLQGTTFEPRDVRLALVEASEGKAGTFMDQLQLSCLTFDPVSRTWSLKAMTLMKIGGVVTVAGMLIMVFLMLRRERRRLPATGPSPS